MNDYIPGDTFTLEDIMREFGSGSSVPEPEEPETPPAPEPEPEPEAEPDLSWLDEPPPYEPPWPPRPIEEPVKRKKPREQRERRRKPKKVRPDLYEDEYFDLEAEEEDYTLAVRGKGAKKARRPERLPELPRRVRSAEHIVRDSEHAAHGRGLRLRICLIVTAVNLLLAVYNGLGLHWIRGFENVAAMGVICLLLLVTAMAVSWDVLAAGFKQIGKADYGPEALTALLCVLAIPETVFAIRALRLPLCAPISLVLLCALWALDRKEQALRQSAQTVLHAGYEAVSVRRISEAWNGADAAACAPAEPGVFEAMLEAEDPLYGAARWFVPAAVLLTALLAAVGAIIGRVNFLWLWTAMLLAAAPLGGILSFSLPFSLVSGHLSHARAALNGWYGARVLRRCEALFVEDEALFPGQALRLSGVKVFGGFTSAQVMQCCAALLEAAGCHIASRLNVSGDNVLPVQALRLYDEGGVGGEIGPESVLAGTWSFMKQMGVHMEEGTRIRQALYVSIRGELAGLIALRYEAAPKVAEALQRLSGAAAPALVLTGTDMLITPGLLRAKFRLPLKRLVSLPLRKRQELPQPAADAVPGAVLSKSSLDSYAAAALGARTLVGVTRAELILGGLAALGGIALAFLLAITGKMDALNCARALAFAGAWALISLLALIPAFKK